MLTKDGKNVPIEELTPENYLVKENEKNTYHIRLEVVQFDPKTGAKMSRPRIQKIGRKTFRKVYDSLLKQGYKIEVLYSPEEWFAKKTAELAQKKEARKPLTQADFDAAVAKAVAEALANMQKAEEPEGKEAEPEGKEKTKTNKK